MRLKINDDEIFKMKIEAKNKVNNTTIVIFCIYLLFFIVYIVLRLMGKTNLSSGTIVIICGLFVTTLSMIINNYRIDKCFKIFYTRNRNIIDYELKDTYISMNNLVTKRKVTIYRVEIKKILCCSYCSIIILKDRSLYVLPKNIILTDCKE